MSFIKSKKFILLSILIVIFLVFFLTISLRPKNIVSQKPEETSKTGDKKQSESIAIDFNGDGVNEMLKVIENDNNSVDMIAYDVKGTKITELTKSITLYPTFLYKVIKLNENSQKQYLQWDMATGPHHVETVFLTIVDGKIYPIYSVDFEKNTLYTPFYNSRGGIVVDDLNKDGLKEIIENVDEYPINAPRLQDPNIEKAIREGFSKVGLSEDIIKSDIEIVTRENYGKGRGRKVIMAIHSFVDEDPAFFLKLTGIEYEKLAGPLINAANKLSQNSTGVDGLMRYSDLEQESKDFNAFVRDFWTHGRPFEITITED